MLNEHLCTMLQCLLHVYAEYTVALLQEFMKCCGSKISHLLLHLSLSLLNYKSNHSLNQDVADYNAKLVQQYTFSTVE